MCVLEDMRREKNSQVQRERDTGLWITQRLKRPPPCHKADRPSPCSSGRAPLARPSAHARHFLIVDIRVGR